MNLTEARKILKNNGYKILTESSSDESPVYLYLEKPDNSKVKVWFETYGQDASDVRLNLNIDYFKGLLSKLGVSDKFFTLLDKLDWDAIKETYEYEGDVYAFGEAESKTWDNGAFGGNNNPDYDWGGEISAQIYNNIKEDDVSYFLKNVAAESLVILLHGDSDTYSMYDYMDNGKIEDIFTDEENKKYIDEFGVTVDDVVDFVNAMSNDNLLQTLAKDISETPDYSEDLN